LRTSLASLPGHLKQGTQPLYLLFGAEILLVEEALDQIRSRAMDDGFQERLRFTSEAGFDWNQLLDQSQAMSLFAEKRLIELRIPTGKPGDAGAKALIQYVQNPLSSDTSLIIICGAVEKRTQGTKWFRAVEEAGVAIECPVIGVDRLPDWISQRLTASGLKYEMEAVEQLSHFVEGNLLAAAQEINLLGLLYPDETITTDIVEHVIADHARFNVYNLADACLAGKVHRVTRILQSLKQEQIQPVLIMWALARDVRTLCSLSAAVEKGENPNALFRRFHIWSNRSVNMNSALRRLPRAQWENILRRLGRADLMVKGRAPMQRKDIWEEIESISLGMCGLKIL
jgi:DNA polymerase-3 subunit delta